MPTPCLYGLRDRGHELIRAAFSYLDEARTQPRQQPIPTKQLGDQRPVHLRLKHIDLSLCGQPTSRCAGTENNKLFLGAGTQANASSTCVDDDIWWHVFHEEYCIGGV